MAALLFANLNSNTAVAISSFAVGFNHGVKIDQQTLHSPLTALGRGTLFGTLTLIGGSFVGGFMPKNIRFMFPVVVTASICYLKYHEINNFNNTHCRSVNFENNS